MPFIRMEGVVGMVFVPEDAGCNEKKHPCADCHSCQWCADERCALCLRRGVKNQNCDVDGNK